MKNTQKPRNPNVDLRSRKVNTYSHESFAEGRCHFSGSIQVDAAAEVEEDEVLCDGGGAQAAVGL